jgi:hypothetical protein
MSTASEKSFGARVRNARMLSNMINNLPTYVANHPEEHPLDFANFVTQLEAINDEEANTASAYSTAVAGRREIYKKGDNSIFALIGKVKTAVSIKYGKSSEQLKQIAALVKTMTNTKPARKEDATDPTKINKVSQSQKSYGSSIQYFRNIISKLNSFGDYSTSVQGLNIADLQTVAAAVETFNSQVDTSAMANKQAKEDRTNLYAKLTVSANNIRNYILLAYGKNSALYKGIKKLAF